MIRDETRAQLDLVHTRATTAGRDAGHARQVISQAIGMLTEEEESSLNTLEAARRMLRHAQDQLDDVAAMIEAEVAR